MPQMLQNLFLLVKDILIFILIESILCCEKKSAKSYSTTTGHRELRCGWAYHGREKSALGFNDVLPN